MNLEKHSKLITTTLFLILFLELFFSQSLVSMTFDEPLHIAAGYSKLITGDFRMNSEHPPLMHLIEALPLLIIKPTLNLTEISWTQKNLMDFIRKFFFEYNKNPRQILEYSRLPIIALTILLGALIYKWTRELFGTNSAIIALTIYTFEPNILAHGILATTDMGFAFFTFLALYCYWKFFNTQSTQTLLLAGITMGLAQLTKYTAIFLWPTYFLIILAASKNFSKITPKFSYPFQNKIKNKFYKQIYFQIISFGTIILISLLLINATYLFKGTGTPIQQAMLEDTTLNKEIFSPQKIFGTNKITNYLAQNIPNPLPYHYAKGLGFVLYEGKTPKPNIIFGKYYERGAWHYYVAAFIAKTTITLILLIILSAILPQNKSKKQPNNQTTKQQAWQFILIPITIILLALSSATKQIGIRYILAIFPFLIIWVSGRITNTNTKITTNKIFKYLLIILLIAHATSSIAQFPNYLSYYNEAIGPENGWKYFADTNTDWGQDFDKLRTYVLCKPDTKIQYFGTNDLNFYGLSNQKAKESCEKENIAISASEAVFNKKFEWLKNQLPKQKIGNSILLYNITNCTIK